MGDNTASVAILVQTVSSEDVKSVRRGYLRNVFTVPLGRGAQVQGYFPVEFLFRAIWVFWDSPFKILKA